MSLCRYDWFHSFIKIFSVDDIQQAVSNFPLVLFHIKTVTEVAEEMDRFLWALHLLLFLSSWVWLPAPTWYLINIQFQGIQLTLLVLVSAKHTCYTQTCAGNLTILRISSLGKLVYWPPILISFSILLFVLLGKCSTTELHAEVLALVSYMTHRSEWIDINQEVALKYIGNWCLQYLLTFWEVCMQMKHQWSASGTNPVKANTSESMDKHSHC